MTMRTLECDACGDSQYFDTWPEQDSDDVLDQLIRSEEWTFTGGKEFCPSCSEDSDE